MGVRERFETIKVRIEAAARAAGRALDDVTLIAVSKTHAANLLLPAIEAGITDFGENRVQEADAKIEKIGRKRVT